MYNRLRTSERAAATSGQPDMLTVEKRPARDAGAKEQRSSDDEVDVPCELLRVEAELGKLSRKKKLVRTDEQLYEKGLRALRAQLVQYRDAVELREGLHRRLRILETKVELTDKERGWLVATAPMPAPQRRLMGSVDQQAPGWGPGCGEVSFRHMPHPDCWDDSWTRRVASMTTCDMLILHKQWLHEAAMLIPRVEMVHALPGETGASVLRQFSSINERYLFFTQRAMALAPEAWQRRSGYDMETLALMPSVPGKDRLIEFASSSNNQELTAEAGAVFMAYMQSSGQLRAERKVMEQRHRELSLKALELSPGGVSTQMMAQMWQRSMESSPQPHSHSGGSSGHGSSRSSASCAAAWGAGAGVSVGAACGNALLELHELVERLATNMEQDQAALRRCLCAMQAMLYKRDPVAVIKGYLFFYPLTLDIGDFMDPEILHQQG